MKFKDLQQTLINILKRHVTQSEIARALDLDKSSITMRIKRDSELNMNHIRKIEEAFEVNLEQGVTNFEADIVTLERINISPSCGKGTYVLDDAEVTPITLGKQLIKNILGASSVSNLKVFRAIGDSMEPTIYNGDEVLVDLGDLDFYSGGVFVIEKFGDWFIKRLRMKFDGSLEIISDNKDKYSPEIIKMSDGIEINIKGRVIKNLSHGL